MREREREGGERGREPNRAPTNLFLHSTQGAGPKETGHEGEGEALRQRQTLIIITVKCECLL